MVEYLDGENESGRENALARQRFCPLQRIGFVVFFWGVRRTRNGAG
jgi:hypothetical protein